MPNILEGTRFSSDRPEIVDFGSVQGRSEFETADVARYVEDFK
jgi:hypothetical protein